MRRKIYPVVDVSDNFEEHLVDDVLASVNADIKKVSEEAELFTKQMTGDDSRGDNRISFNNKAPTNGDRNSKASPIGPSVGAVSEKTMPIRRYDSAEEIKLTHEIVNSNNQMYKDLQTRIKLLEHENEEMKRQAAHKQDKLKKSDRHVQEMETMINEMEEEALKLKQQLVTQGNGLNSTATNPNQAAAAGGAGGKGLTQSDQEMLKRHEQFRKALLFENDEEEENKELNALSFEKLFRSANIYSTLKKYVLLYCIPLRRDILTIQSRFGTAVASYFILYQFMFLQMLLVGLFTVVYFFLHISTLSEHNLPSSQYLESTGYMPYIMSTSSFSSDEGLLYDIIILTAVIIIFVTICMRIVLEDQLSKNYTALEMENHTPYSKEILGIWDNSVKHYTTIDELSSNIANKLLQQLEETRMIGRLKSRTRYELALLYTRRVVGMLLYLAVVFGSFAIIVYVTLYSNDIATLAQNIPGLSNFNSLIVPFILNVVNGAVPTLLQYITEFEQWDSAKTVTDLVLLRMYVSNVLNTLLLAVSYLVLADPFLIADKQTLRNSFGIKINEQFSCRLDQVGQGLFTLVIFTWAIDCASLLAVPVAYQIIAYLRKKTFEKIEFTVAQNMVKRLNFMGLVFLSLPFSPLTLVFTPFFLFFGFKWEKQVIKHYYAKPVRQWSGQTAGFVNAIVYFCSFLVIGLTICGYFLSSKTFAKSCDIQDKFVHLCLDTVQSDNTCSTDPTSIYYAYYGSTQYPSSVCQNACGPFIHSRSNFQPFLDALTEYPALNYIWDICFDYSYVPWAVTIILALGISTTFNSLDVQKFSAYNQTLSLQSQLVLLDSECKKQERLIKRLKVIEDRSMKMNGSDDEPVDESDLETEIRSMRGDESLEHEGESNEPPK